MKKSENCFVEPVTIVSVTGKNKINFATIAWAARASYKPYLITVSVHPNRYTHKLLENAEEFCVNVLSENQKNLSTLAGTKTGWKEDKSKLEEFDWTEGESVNAPRLKGCVVCYECKKINAFTTGDHTIFVGEVIKSHIDDNQKPLMLFRREYYKLGDFIDVYP